MKPERPKTTLKLSVTTPGGSFEAEGEKHDVMVAFVEWLRIIGDPNAPRLREMTAQLSGSSDALEEAITRANKGAENAATARP